MKETLILLTACYRFDNLLYIAKSININYDLYNNDFNIIWLICKDNNNGYGDIDKAIDYLKTTNIHYYIKDSGKPNQKNYGGDMFNLPLISLVNELSLDNPWIYILDDDNIVHPNIYKIFKLCLDNNFYDDKQAIATINKWNLGHNREMYEANYLINDRNSFIQEWHILDPSAVILRYSIVQKYGMYSNDFLYDFYWLNLIVLSNEGNNIIWPNMYENSFGRHIVGSYHNGLVNNYEQIKELVDKLDTTAMDILLSNLDIECPQNIPILSLEAKEKIINIIKEDILK